MHALEIGTALAALFVLLPLGLWSPAALLFNIFILSVQNRPIKDEEGVQPEEARAYSLIYNQLVWVGSANVVAGAFAGLGASLFVKDDRIYLPSSQTPLIFIGSALILVVVAGGLVTNYVTRPVAAWVTNPAILRSYLRDIRHSSRITEDDLADMRKRLKEWEEKTSVLPLSHPDELHLLGLELQNADAEWAYGAKKHIDNHGRKLSSDVTTRQVRGWMRKKHMWLFCISPWVSGSLIAFAVAGFATKAGLPRYLSLILLGLSAIVVIFLLRKWAFRQGRLELVMVNRLRALERKQIADCNQLISQIEERHQRETALAQARPDQNSSRLALRIGRISIDAALKRKHPVPHGRS